jgi:hypothetical protein
MGLVSRYGRMWARNPENVAHVAREHKKATLNGVYVLYDGSMPVYVGKGKIANRLDGHGRGRKKDFWDYFSWFEIRDEHDRHDVEVILLKTLPYYLRLFNKQAGAFTSAQEIGKTSPNRPIPVDKPHSFRSKKRKS